jgi:hypothetical protein
MRWSIKNSIIDDGRVGHAGHGGAGVAQWRGRRRHMAGDLGAGEALSDMP